MQYKYSLPNEKSFTIQDLIGFVYSDAKNYDGIDAVRIIADGSSGQANTGYCDRIYLVLVGTGEFVIDGNVIEVTKDDVIVLPKNTSYEYHGSMELFEVNSLAFRSE